MAKQVFSYLLAAVLISVGGFLEAQVSPAPVPPGASLSRWRVYHTEGTITVNQGGAKTVLQGGQGAQREIVLGPRDMIQTGDGRAELQMISGTSVDQTYTIVKLRENTSLLIGRPENGEPVLELLYGKVRLITGTAASSMIVRAGASVASLRNCDTAIDYIVSPGVTQPVLSFHFFSGEGELIPRSSQGIETAKLHLSPEESITLEYQTPFSYVERRALDDSAVEYWSSTPFSEGAPLPMPVAELAAVPEEPKLAEEPDAEPDEPVTPEPEPPPSTRVTNAPKNKHIFAITGILLAVAGTAVQTYSLMGNPSPALRDPLFYGSYAPLGVGVGFIIMSSFFYPGKASSGK